MGSWIEQYNVGTHKRCGGRVNKHAGDWGGYIDWLVCEGCGKEVQQKNLKKKVA